MKFNKFDGSGPQEIMLMKQAIEEALKPTSEPQLITITNGSSTIIEGEYSGFSIYIPENYTESIQVKINDDDTSVFNMVTANIYTMNHGVLEYGSNWLESKRRVLPGLHTMQKYSIIKKLEFSVAPITEEPMGLETDLVLIK